MQNAHMRVDGPLARGLWPPVGGGLWKRVVEKGCGKRFLGLTGPMGRRVLKFDGLSGRGLWYRPQGDEYEVSVTGLAVCVICDTISSATYFLVSP